MDRKFWSVETSVNQSSFVQIHKIGNVGIIANFLFLYICNFLLYLHHLMFARLHVSLPPVSDGKGNVFTGVFLLIEGTLVSDPRSFPGKGELPQLAL